MSTTATAYTADVAAEAEDWRTTTVADFVCCTAAAAAAAAVGAFAIFKKLQEPLAQNKDDDD